MFAGQKGVQATAQVQRAQTESWVQDVYVRSYARLVSALVHLTDAASSDCEEAVQDAFLRLLRKSRDGLAALRRTPPVAEASANDDEAAMDLRRALAELAPIQRSALVLHYYLDLSVVPGPVCGRGRPRAQLSREHCQVASAARPARAGLSAHSPGGLMTTPDDLPELTAALRGAEPLTPPFEESMAGARSRRTRRMAALAAGVTVAAGAILVLAWPAPEGTGGQDALVLAIPTGQPAPTTSAPTPVTTPTPSPVTSPTPIAGTPSPSAAVKTSLAPPPSMRPTLSASPRDVQTSTPASPPGLPASYLREGKKPTLPTPASQNWRRRGA